MDNESVKEVLEQFYQYMHRKEWFDDPGAESVFNAFTDLIVSQNNRIVELENKVKQLEEYRQLVKVLAGSIEVIKTERDDFETSCRQMVSKIRSMEYEIDYLKNGDENDD